MSDRRWITISGRVLAALLIITGSTQVYFGVLRPLTDVLLAKGWIEGRLVSGRALVLPFDGIMHAEFEYVCESHGRQVHGRRYAFVHPTEFLSADQLLKLDGDLRGACYVDPAHPTRAVVSRELPARGYRYAGLPVLALGVAVLCWLQLLRRRLVRALVQARVALRVAGCLLVACAGYGLGHSTSVREAGLTALGLLAPALSLTSAAPLLLRVSAVWFCCLSLIAPCIALLALLGVTTDDLHDPGFIVEHVANWTALMVVMWTLAYASLAAPALLDTATKALRARSAA